MGRLNKAKFTTWLQRRRTAAGLPPYAKKSVNRRWRSYRISLQARHVEMADRARQRVIVANLAPPSHGCAHDWRREPDRIRCTKCQGSLFGDLEKVWARLFRPPAPLPAKPARLINLHRRERQFMREAGLDDPGLQASYFRGQPAWSRGSRTHPSSDRGA